MSGGTELQRLTAWFERQVGTAETGPNNVIYNTHYYDGPVSGDAYPWCCAFIWDGFRECGLSALFCGGQKTAYCPFVYNYARTHGLLVTDGYRAGDLLLYDWNGDGQPDHIGFCAGASGSMLTVIEGNVSDRVMRLTRTASSVKAAYRPRYSDQPDKTPAAAEMQQAPAYRPGDRYMVQAGDTLWSIAERFLGDGSRWDELYSANGLSSTMIHPGQVIVLPGERGTVDAEDPDPAPVPPAAEEGDLPQLRPGDSGQVVKVLQILLRRAGYALPVYGVDGDFGAETETALRDFQRAQGIPETGTVTPVTWAVLLS